MNMKPPPSPRSKLSRNIWALTLTSLLTDISSEMIVNVLPLFLANVLGARIAIIGLIEGMAETTASLVKMISGRISDVSGRRKPLAVLGYGLSALAKPFLYFANAWGWVLSVRFTDRLGKGIRTAPRDALLAGSVDTNRRGYAFGLHRAGDTAGAFIGLGIAAWIIWHIQASDTLLTRETFQWIVLASIIPAVLAVLVLALGVKERQQFAQQSANRQFHWKELDPRFRAFIGITVLFTLGNSSDAFIILRAQERGLSVLQVMGMLMTFNAVYALLSGPAGMLSDRIGRGRLILFGWIAYAGIYLGLAAAKSGSQVWLLFALYGVYYALTEGSAKALVADLVPDEQRGTAYGLYHAAIGVAVLPASLVAGVLWQGIGMWSGFGPSAPFYFGAFMALGAGILFWARVN